MRTALIFDLDGTLWDATVPITESWNIVGRKHYGPDYFVSVDTVRGLMGKTMAEIAEALTPKDAAPETIPAFVDDCFSYEREYLVDHPGSLFPFEEETLELLAKTYDLYIVSNCQSGYIENFIPLVREGLILGHRCWSDTRKDKQFTIRLLMEQCGIEEAIYIGDTNKDEAASRAAGVGFVFAAYGFGTALAPDGVAHSFEELPKAVAEAESCMPKYLI